MEHIDLAVESWSEVEIRKPYLSFQRFFLSVTDAEDQCLATKFFHVAAVAGKRAKIISITFDLAIVSISCAISHLSQLTYPSFKIWFDPFEKYLLHNDRTKRPNIISLLRIKLIKKREIANRGSVTTSDKRLIYTYISANIANDYGHGAAQ